MPGDLADKAPLLYRPPAPAAWKPVPRLPGSRVELLLEGVEDLPDWGSAGGLSGCASFAPGKPIRGEAGLGRRFRIAKQGSRSTVVWNPWEAQAVKMGDLGPEGYLGTVCVESGNALEDVVPVAAGAEHTLTVRYSVERRAA